MALVLVLLAAAGAVAWRTWGRATAGPFDPVNAVIAAAALAATLVVAWAAVRGLRQADSDPAVVASRLAVAVRRAEERERRQLLGGSDRVLAIGLMLDLLAGRGPDDPVPVRLSAAALGLAGPEETLVERWLADQLERVYGLSRAAAAGVVAARLALPVLDGLDEMDPGEEPGYGSRAARGRAHGRAHGRARGRARGVAVCRAADVYPAAVQAVATLAAWTLP